MQPTIHETTPPLPAAPAGAASSTDNPTILAIKDLISHARMRELALADEVLTDVLAKLNGWPVEELNRLR